MLPSSDLADAFVTRTIARLGPTPGKVLVQAGHFMVFGYPSAKLCVPGVFEELLGGGLEIYRQRVQEAVGVFPTATWTLGVMLATRLRAQGVSCELVTVVNDWQFVPKLWPGGTGAARREFYKAYRAPLATYAGVLSAAGLDASALARLNGRPDFVSEQWLRNRLVRHLSSMRRSEPGSNGRLRWSTRDDGSACLEFHSSGEPVCVVSYGSTDCAGEVMELQYLVAKARYETFVNFHPLQCTGPVTEGTRRACDLFALERLNVVNIGLSCAGEQTLADMLSREHTSSTT